MRHLAPTGAICQPRPGCALRTRTTSARPALLSPPAACHPPSLPSGPLPQPPLPGGPVWGTKEPASALSGRTFPAARRTRPLRFELWQEWPAPSRAAAPYPLQAGHTQTWGGGGWGSEDLEDCGVGPSYGETRKASGFALTHSFFCALFHRVQVYIFEIIPPKLHKVVKDSVFHEISVLPPKD